MKIVLIAIVTLMIFGTFLPDFGKKQSVILQTKSGQQINLDMGSAIGNHTYLPVNISCLEPDKYVKPILQIFEAFEKKNPGLEITSWNLDLDRYSGKIYGIWVDHRPKKK